MSDKIHLRLIREGDKIRVIDQDGRELAGLIAVGLTASIDSAVEIDIRCVDYNRDNQPHLGQCE